MWTCPARVFLGSVFNDLHAETETTFCCMPLLPYLKLFLLKVLGCSLNIKVYYRCCFKEVFQALIYTFDYLIPEEMSARPRVGQSENNLINTQKPLFEVIDCNFVLDLEKSNLVKKITVLESIKMFDLLLVLSCSKTSISFANQADLLLCSAFVKAHNLAFIYKDYLSFHDF